MKRITLIITIALVFGLSIVSAQSKTEDHAIGAWVADVELEKDIFIRDIPSGFGKMLGEIPSVLEDKDRVQVSIIGYSKGWLRIQLASKLDETVLFSGKGWIKANRVNAAVIIKNGKPVSLYSKPNVKSKKVGTLAAKTQFEIIGFDQFGLKIRFKGKTGWLSRNNICGEPETLCSEN